MAFERIPVSIHHHRLSRRKANRPAHRLLKDPDMADAAIIINEFGDVSIDHLLVERSGDGIIELAEGCLCCTVRGELVDTLAELMDGIQTGRLKPVKRVVIETTGLADPAPVMQSIMGNPVIAQNFMLNGVITVVDAVNGASTLDHHEEALKQVAVADRLVLTKRKLAYWTPSPHLFPPSVTSIPVLRLRMAIRRPGAPPFFWTTVFMILPARARTSAVGWVKKPRMTEIITMAIIITTTTATMIIITTTISPSRCEPAQRIDPVFLYHA